MDSAMVALQGFEVPGQAEHRPANGKSSGGERSLESIGDGSACTGAELRQDRGVPEERWDEAIGPRLDEVSNLAALLLPGRAGERQ